MNLDRVVLLGVIGAAIAGLAASVEAGVSGYFRQPAIAGGTIVFVSEGDLWKVPATGGVARRLTSHPGDESNPAISQDGKTVAFSAQYEGPGEIYTMPLEGGLPTRWTWDGARSWVSSWTPDGKLKYNSDGASTLPNMELYTLDPGTRRVVREPLAQVSDAVVDGRGRTFFVRLPFQGSHTKRYKGGFVQQIWRWDGGDAEAVLLTGDFEGTSKRPMLWRDRVYFVSDRDGWMNIWSMDGDGKDLKQHTKHEGFDVMGASLGDGLIAYQLGADLWIFDVAQGSSRKLDVTLDTDLDQTRERWVKKPIDYMTAARISPNGDRVAITARGSVFVAPVKQGRFVDVLKKSGVRAREARFLPTPPDFTPVVGETVPAESLVYLSDASGEVEVWTAPANGVGQHTQLTTGGDKLRWDGTPSPDGRYIAHHDKDLRLFLYDLREKTNTLIDRNEIDGFEGIEWSNDGAWLAYVTRAANGYKIIRLYSTADGSKTDLTTDRYESFSPAWSADGKWLYFLSERNLDSVVESPWGNFQPEPFFDNRVKIYQIALRKGERSPFQPMDEIEKARLEAEKREKVRKEKEKDKEKQAGASKPEAQAAAVTPGAPAQDAEPKVEDATEEAKKKPKEEPKEERKRLVIDLAGIQQRLIELPIEPGNYGGLMVGESAIYWLATESGNRESDNKPNLLGAAITNEKVEVKTLVGDVKSAELSLDRKKILIHKGDGLFVIDAAPAPADLSKAAVDLSGWSLSVIPRDEWRQMYLESWRLMRDYFYDRNMHGVDWRATYERYLPLVDRVASRAELSDVMAQMVGDLSALHHFVRGGDTRRPPDEVAAASLGARLVRDEDAGGYRVEHVYLNEPDEPGGRSPLSRPGVDVVAGDVIESVNGISTLTVPDIGVLLRQRVGKQVLLRIKPAAGELRDVIVSPISSFAAADLRYDEWQYIRRLMVDRAGDNQIGYVHLRAMGGENIAEWAKNYYPVFNRKGLIIDVRNNRGGNIDSWILNRLLRKVWFYWNQHAGRAPIWNMQQAFRGHVVVLCDERTASDGEAFAEGFRRLGLGKVIGRRTWGGEIWLSSSNVLVDKGIASASEFGVFGPEGEWLIEGRGVEPDIEVDNLPSATFKGEDAQLQAAIKHLQELIAKDPRDLPPVPPLPDKSFRK